MSKELQLQPLEFNKEIETFKGIRCDYFKKYEREDGVKMIKNIYGEVLIAHSDGNAGPVPIFDHRTLAEQTGNDSTNFNLVLYRTQLLKRMPRGIPIVFQIKVAGSDYHMYCTEEGDRKVVKFKEGSAPKNVEDNMKNIIFYQQMFDNTYSQFESAWALGWFLCTEAANRSHILGLKKVEKNQDEMIAVGLENVQ
ncbi:interleukin-18-like isoform X3 [Chiloscyllium plagiosum]|uniref:interleukin-18-like isoform X3 n=1 Tax=Chiloscyllium plagiosum TaxID=36176 RepID=UPI001CB8797B|nr:interleukin-18-like isoform X3 [Chiloscyllium plagiosum]